MTYCPDCDSEARVVQLESHGTRKPTTEGTTEGHESAPAKMSRRRGGRTLGMACDSPVVLRDAGRHAQQTRTSHRCTQHSEVDSGNRRESC